MPEEGCHWAEDRVNSFVVLDCRGKSGEVTGAPLRISLVHNPQVDPVGSKDLQDDCQKDGVEKLGKNPVSEKMDDNDDN